MIGERTRAACLADAMRVAMPVDVTDATRFPNIAGAAHYLAGLTPERREQLQRDWEN